MKAKLLLILLFFFSIVNSQTKIQMEKQGGVYYLPCKVNGLDLRFIFDTGASDVSISLSEAVFMLKNGYLSKEDIGENVYYSIANGDIAKGTKINLREIEIGGLKLKNVNASIVHELGAPLLLGQSVIENLGKIQINKDELIIIDGINYEYNPVKGENIVLKSHNDFNFTNKTFVGKWILSEIKKDIPQGYNVKIFDLDNIDCFINSVWELKNGYNGKISLKSCGNKVEKVKWEVIKNNFQFMFDKKNNTFGYRLLVNDASYHNFELIQILETKIGEMHILYKFTRQ